MTKIPLADDVMEPVARVSDGQGFFINWSGGLRTAQRNEDQWQILPLQHDNKPHISGFYAKAAMEEFMGQRGAKFIAFQEINWTGGEYATHWVPYIPGETNFSQSPADRWNQVAKNLSRARTQPLLAAIENPTMTQIEEIMDAYSEHERLARSIAISLRNLDNSVSRIAEFYHVELTNLLARGSIDGKRHATTRDQTLFALVHSFFLHLGGARDYLAAFVALELGLDVAKTDSMARLVEELPGHDSSGSTILSLLATKGYVQPKPAPSTKWKVAGWLEEVTDLRNEFVHRRTYGHTMAERYGCLRPLDVSVGLFRYFRPISWKGADQDTLDVVISHYERVNELFFAAAAVSGHDMSIPHIPAEDIISTNLTSGG